MGGDMTDDDCKAVNYSRAIIKRARLGSARLGAGPALSLYDYRRWWMRADAACIPLQTIQAERY